MNKGCKRFLSLMLTATLTFSLVVTWQGSNIKAEGLNGNDKIKQMMKEEYLKARQSTLNKKQKQNEQSGKKEKSPDEIVRVIVQMDKEPNVKNESVSEKKLMKAQEATKIKVEKLEGAKIRQTYTYLLNGFSMKIKRSEISKVRNMTGVKSVQEANIYYPVMNNATKITKAYDVWKNLGYKGEGLVISIIDTGIDVNNKDMKLTDPSRAKIKNIEQGKDSKFTVKVPYGYNFADKNDDIKAAEGTSEHGMHVAGIVAANGDEGDRFNSIKGVAPEAQLLAMKVFSNNPGLGGCYDDDIISAIEESVKHGADIINMSLGGPAGFQDASNPTEIAIKNATDKGVIVVVAAGNDAVSTDVSNGGTPVNKINAVDTSIISAPATAEDALSVASFENDITINKTLNVNIGGKDENFVYISSESDPSDILKAGGYSIVNCGEGGNEDYWNLSEQLAGKIALVKYTGKSSSVTLRNNAMWYGAIGVIIYSNDGDETCHNMTPDKSLIPAAWIKNSDGLKLVSAKSDEAKVTFTGAMIESESSLKGEMSTFTSFGPTPNLELKPEISAPGGNIYSTINDSKYEVMSGTSMASPHIAGASALVIESLKKNMENLSGRALVEFAKNTLVSTSKVQLDKEFGQNKVPYSPRRQGAGVADIQGAINNTVLLTGENNKSVVSLKETGDNISFKLKVKNYGKDLVNYDLYTEGVLAEKIVDAEGHFADYIVPGAETKFSKNSITLNGQAEDSIEVNITLPKNLEKDRFVEGFIHLKDKSNKAPDLVIPYMGFYGDWSKPAIIDKPGYEEGSLLKTTYLTEGLFVGLPVCLGQFFDENADVHVVDPETVAISPNGDDSCEFVEPYLALLRNAKDIKVDVVDKNDGTEKVLREISKEKNLRKGMLYNLNSGAQMYYSGMWDGTLYNKTVGKYELAKDGKYFIRMTTKVDLKDAKPQVMYLSVKVDTEAPKVNILSTEKDLKGDIFTLKWTQNDEGVGASKMMGEIGTNQAESSIYLNGERIFIEKDNIKVENNVYTTEIKLDTTKANQVSVGVMDSAINVGVDTIALTSLVNFDNLKGDTLLGKSMLKDGVYVLKGIVSKDVKALEINGEKVTITSKNNFDFNLKVKEGVNEVKVIAKDSDGKVIENLTKTYKVTVDTESPVIKITSPEVNGEDGIVANGEMLLIKGIVTDNQSKYDKLKVKIGYSSVDLNSDGSFEVSTRLWEAHNVIDIVAEDEADNSATASLSVGREDTTEPFEIKFENLEPLTIMSKQQNLVKDGVFTIKGSVTNRISTLRIDDKDVKIKKDLSFEVPVVLDSVKKKVSVYAKDANGKVYYNYNYTILYDEKAPNVSISEPIEYTDGNVYTNKDTLKFKGIAEDNGFGYSLSVNGNNIITLNQFPIKGEKQNKKEFEYELKVENNEKVLLEASDIFDNKFSKAYNVVVDKVAPKITVEGVEEGKVYSSSVKPQVKVSEENTTLTMTLDGKLYLGTEIAEEGNHKLVVSSVDRAGNLSEEFKVSFTIDKTAPVITVSGVEDGKVYTEAVTPVVKVNEKATINMTLDGKTYDGAAIKNLGKHTLVVTAIDEAGNKSEKTISFTIEEKKVEEEKPKDEGNKPVDNNNIDKVDGKTSEGTKLVKTGSVIDMNTLVVLGTIIVFMGVALFYISMRKEKKI